MQIDNAQTEKDIDSILDESENMSIINSSGWPVTQQITLANKTALLQGLIFDEVTHQTWVCGVRNTLWRGQKKRQVK